MVIRCYGARGSIPVSGPEYLRYGGDTACLEIRTEAEAVLIVDAGSGIRRLGNRLLQEGRFQYSIVFTHSHWDHILGFPFFKPIFQPQSLLNLMGCPIAQGNIEKWLSRAMSAPYFPVPFSKIKARINFDCACQLSFQVDAMEVSRINLSHTNPGFGYRFTEAGSSLVFLTDNELRHPHKGAADFAEYVEFARDADLLIHDAEYTPEEYPAVKGWGHSTYVDALELAREAGVKRLGLFHHNQDRTDLEVDEIVAACRTWIARNDLKLDCFALSQTSEITL